jgi:hypothetical protein
MPICLNQVLVLIKKEIDKGELALDEISDMAESEPKIFKYCFQNLFEICKNIILIKDIDQGIK